MTLQEKHNISYYQIFLLALPVVLSNATIPIQGLIDVAIVGHMSSPEYLSAIGLAGEFFSLLFVSFNFLQYSSSGLAAQAFGFGDNEKLQHVLYRALIVAFIIGLILIILQQLWFVIGVWFFSISGVVERAFLDYASIRIWAAPIVLSNYALLGWFVGQGYSSLVLRQQLLISISNVCFNLFFVTVLDYGVTGVALGTVLAHSLGLLYALSAVQNILFKKNLNIFGINYSRLFLREELLKLMHLNRDIMIRTFVLTLSFAWIMKLGSMQGEMLLAANVVLLQLLFISAYAIDGVAVATESLVGQAYSNNKGMLNNIILQTTFASVLIAMLISVIYFLTEELFLSVMTDLPNVREIARNYYIFAAFLPLAGVLAYQFDGVMFGLTANTIIRQSIIIVAIIFFPISTMLSVFLGNTGVWLSVYLLFFLRAVTLIYKYKRMKLGEC
ncbi:MAG: MATE family efflux transporter [Gammaproteobacteria bacterium]|nr:MATE family efflux transporter [Gammaproteobacteria bacterium]